MGGTAKSPAALHRNEDVWQFFDERGLLFRRDHYIAVPLFGGSERSEDSASDSEVDRAHMGAFLGAFEREGNAAEIDGVHVAHCSAWVERIEDRAERLVGIAPSWGAAVLRPYTNAKEENMKLQKVIFYLFLYLLVSRVVDCAQKNAEENFAERKRGALR